MKLLVVSHTPHYLQNGFPVGWGPTVREIDQLARLFESVIHLAVLYPGAPPQSSLGYQAKNIHLLSVRPAGGDTWFAKLGLLRAYPGYWSTLKEAVSGLDEDDCVHVRCPANLSLLAISRLAVTHKPKYRWVKYAGNWQPSDLEPLSYKYQRWWLARNLHRGTVTVNGNWLNQEPHVITFPNPSFTQQELQISGSCVLTKQLQPTLRLLFIGRVEDEKGTGRVIAIAKILQACDISFRIDIVGDGSRRKLYETEVKRLDLEEMVIFHGWLDRDGLNMLYKLSHFLVLPTTASEGWPKVLSEGMAYGVIPLAGAVSSIPQILAELQIGKALDPYDLDGFVRAIQNYLSHPEQWKAESLAGVKAAEQFTYEHYLQCVMDMFKNTWGISLPEKK